MEFAEVIGCRQECVVLGIPDMPVDAIDDAAYDIGTGADDAIQAHADCGV